MPEYIIAASLLIVAAVALLVWRSAATWAPAGRKVTVSLTDGSVVSGRVRSSWPGRLRLAEVETAQGEVPGVVVVNGRHIATVQVTA